MSEKTQAENSQAETDAVSEPQEIALNKVVGFHYRLREVFPDGSISEWREQSHGGVPLTYLHGFHNVVVGLEKALEGKTVGASVQITLTPDEAYGQRSPQAIQRVPIKHLQLPQGQKHVKVGMVVKVSTNKGERLALILKAGKFNADVDFNHPLSGKTLYYEIDVIEVRDATEEEIAHGHVHGPGGHEH